MSYLGKKREIQLYMRKNMIKHEENLSLFSWRNFHRNSQLVARTLRKPVLAIVISIMARINISVDVSSKSNKQQQ